MPRPKNKPLNAQKNQTVNEAPERIGKLHIVEALEAKRDQRPPKPHKLKLDIEP